MKSFLSEYGTGLVTVIIVTLLIMMASPVSTTIYGAASGLTKSFAGTMSGEDGNGGVMGNATEKLSSTANAIKTMNEVNTDFLSNVAQTKLETNGSIFTSEELDVCGFWINASTDSGSVSEFSPSLRTVLKASNQITGSDGQLHEVKEKGTLYIKGDANISQMNVDDANKVQCQKGNIFINDKTQTSYYALTIMASSYNYQMIKQEYTFRAYVVLDNGQIVYSNKCYTTCIYDVANDLYQNNKMSTQEQHDYLYMNILDPSDMDSNTSQICNAMFKALGIKSYDDPNYELVGAMSSDIFNYARCQNGYTYQNREEFRCSKVEEELLALLNIAQETQYSSVYDWIYNETSNYGKSDGTKYKGCYKKVKYQFDEELHDYSDFETFITNIAQ